MQQGVQQGLRKGLIKTVEMGLTLKFGEQGLKLMPMIEKIEDNNQLERIREAIKAAKELKEIEDLLL